MRTPSLTREIFKRHAVAPAALAAAIALALSGMALAQSGPPSPPPGQADGVAVAGSTLELIEARQTEEGPSSEPVELLRASFDVRANNATDLVIRVDGECAAWLNEAEPEEEEEPENDVDPAQEEDPESTEVTGATVIAWVELNGQPVPVDVNGADDGTLVFCGAEGSLDLEGTEDDDLIEQFERSRSASGFTWTVEDAGQGFHEVVLLAAIDLHVDPAEDDEENDIVIEQDDENGEDAEPDAFAIFGKRLMSVERAKVAFDDSFDNDF